MDGPLLAFYGALRYNKEKTIGGNHGQIIKNRTDKYVPDIR